MITMSEVRSRFFSVDIMPSQATEKKLRSFLELPDGWHYGEGVRISTVALENALVLNTRAAQLAFRETDGFPGFNGEIMFTIYFREHYLEFTLEPDGNITFCYEQNDQEILYQENLPLVEAIARMEDFQRRLWMQSEYSVENTMIVTSAGSPVSHSRIQALIQESPFFVGDVSSDPDVPSAGIFQRITPQLPVILPSFGSSRSGYCRLVSG